MYADGIKHSLELPYQVFEDKRSGETLGVLPEVRTDVEKLIALAINIVYTTLIGLIFVTISFSIHWVIFPVYALTAPLIAFISSKLSKKIKVIQEKRS